MGGGTPFFKVHGGEESLPWRVESTLFVTCKGVFECTLLQLWWKVSSTQSQHTIKPRKTVICSFNKVCQCLFKLFFHFFVHVWISCCWGIYILMFCRMTRQITILHLERWLDENVAAEIETSKIEFERQFVMEVWRDNAMDDVESKFEF